MTGMADREQPTVPEGKEVVVPATRAAWRRWLSSHQDRQEGLWVVYRKRSSDLEGPVYPELVDEALCYGWIDSTARSIDADRVMQWFSPRRAGSVWSALSKQRVERLIEDGLMTKAGLAAIARAKTDGSWSQSDAVDALVVPEDLEAALAAAPEAEAAYRSMSDSVKRRFLWWVYSAKRPDTRARRIAETVRRLSDGGGPP